MSDDSFTTANAFDDLDPADLPDTVDEAAVRRMQSVAKLLDEAVTIPGTDYKVGIDPVVGAIPVVGDIVSGAISLYIVAESARLGVPYTTLLRMLANVTVDTAGGALPYVGVVFDTFWKSNKWNVELLFEELTSTPDLDQDAVEIEVE